RTIDQSAGGKLYDRNAKESCALLEDLALYDNKSWNDPRDFAKPVKAISLPQDVRSTSDHNKITSSCEICSGPHDTQYCMKNPEQAFVEYASSRTDEVGEKGEQNREGSPENTQSIEEQWDTPQPELKKPTTIDKIGPSGNDEEIEWLDVEEPLDLVDTSEESVYESLIKEMPKCSVNYDFRIKKGNPRNFKISCMIGHKFTANAHIDVDLPMNIISLAYYNSIRKNRYEYRGRNFVDPFLTNLT
ncbi:hypothetical protein Tco_1031411, partial [Tanacetum coccineum]